MRINRDIGGYALGEGGGYRGREGYLRNRCIGGEGIL